MWDTTIAFLTVFLVLFIVGYLVLYWLNRRSLKERNARATFDAERLSKRLEIADAMYARKYGPVADRLGQANVVIQPYADIETYELRGLYRQYEVED